MERKSVQFSLFEERECPPVLPHTADNNSTFSDPAFSSNKRLPIHRWVPWIAGYSQQFVRDALVRYLPSSGTVLDPFAGVGTTLVEAVLSGHRAVGFEINPYAAFACRIKLNAYKLTPDAIRETLAQFQTFCTSAFADTYTPQSTPPPGFKTRSAFYSPQVLHKVLGVQDFITMTLEPGLLRDLFWIAFGATMVTYSNYSYEPSLGRRTTAGKAEIEDFPVGEIIVQKLTDMIADIEWMQHQLAGKEPTSRVVPASFFTCHDHLPAGSVDLLVTSPPYLNNYHYNRNTRPHLYWLGFASTPRDFKPLEEQNFGKFWQTVREEACVELNGAITDPTIRSSVQQLREKHPEKGIYGGNGWANYAASYFNDCYRFSQSAQYALKSKGTALVVIGNSIVQGIMIPTDQFLGTIAESVGLEVVEIHMPRATRVGNSIIQSDVRVEKAKKNHSLYEAVVELRKV